MTISYTKKQLEQLEKLLEKKLFDLEAAQQSAKTPPDEFSELNLTKQILTFVQYLVGKELRTFSIMENESFYDYAYGYQTVVGNASSIGAVDTATICENCRQKNPSHTHCVHRIVLSDTD